MSRSFKKTPIYKGAPDRGSYGKKLANRKVRRSNNISDGSKYKRLFCQYDIHDYIMTGFDEPVNWNWRAETDDDKRRRMRKWRQSFWSK